MSAVLTTIQRAITRGCIYSLHPQHRNTKTLSCPSGLPSTWNCAWLQALSKYLLRMGRALDRMSDRSPRHSRLQNSWVAFRKTQRLWASVASSVNGSHPSPGGSQACPSVPAVVLHPWRALQSTGRLVKLQAAGPTPGDQT
jgi:hypothetical protein